MLTILYKYADGEKLMRGGHLSRREIARLRAKGWRRDEPEFNKNGILISRRRRMA